MNSFISEMPGPLVAVKARAPFQFAPITMPIAASSSSAWITAKLLLPVSRIDAQLRAEALERVHQRRRRRDRIPRDRRSRRRTRAPRPAAVLPSIMM